MRGSRLVLLFLVACWVACGSPREASSALHFHGESEVLPGFDGDTGLQPSGSDVQVQFVVRAKGTVAADGDADAGGSLAVGRAGSGKLVVDGHFLFEGKLAIQISGLPKYDGPIPNLDQVDVRFGGEAAFDPFVLGGTAQVVADLPETKLPEIPLPGGLTGKLVITIVKGSTVTTQFRGICAGVDGGRVQWLGATRTTGQLLLKPTIVVKLPVKGDKSFDLPVIPVDVPAREVAMDLGTHDVGDGDAPPPGAAAATATPGGCGGAGPDGGGVADGATADGGRTDDSAADGSGPPATAQEVPCASASCGVPSSYCCIADDKSESCIGAQLPCSGSKVRCDQAGDCASGVCCATADPTAFTLELACQSSCSGVFAKKACGSDAECGGEKCLVQTCRGRPIALCGGLPPDVEPFCQ